MLYLPISGLQTLVNSHVRTAASVYLIISALLLTGGQLLDRRRATMSLLVLVNAVELLHFSRITVFDRKLLTKHELSSRAGYNDETADAVHDIQAGEQGFFRVTKRRPTQYGIWGSLNDGMVFGYCGTESYSSFNNVHYTDFLTTLGAISPNSELSTRWSFGLREVNNPLLPTFVGEKFVLTDEPDFYRRIRWYQPLAQYGQDYLFRNELFVPLGLTFTRYMTESDFFQLSPDQKAELLFRAVVLPQTDDGARPGLAPLTISKLENEIHDTALPYVITGRRAAALNLTSFRQSRIKGTVRLDQKNLLVVQTPYNRGWRALQDGRSVPVAKVDIGLLGVWLDAGDHKIELRYRNRFLLPAAAISLAALVIVAVGLRCHPRL
jgi:uncharacterized membrane protein YfhO